MKKALHNPAQSSTSRPVRAWKNLVGKRKKAIFPGSARDLFFFALWKSTGKVNMEVFQFDVLFDFTYTSSYFTKIDFVTY